MLSNPILPTILFLIGAFNFILGVVVFRENPKRILNRVTGIMLLFAALGAIFNSITPSVVYIISSQQMSDFSVRFSLLWEMVFPLLLYFSLLFPRKNELLDRHSHAVNILLIPYLLRFLLVLVFPSADHIYNFLVLDVGEGLWGTLVQPISMVLMIIKTVIGWYYKFHPILFIILNIICVGLAIIFMMLGYRKLSDRLSQKRVGFAIAGIGMSVLFFGTAILLPYINASLTTMNFSYIFFLLASICLTSSIAWAIYKYQFLNIRMIIRRGIVSSFIAVFLVALFLLLYGHVKGLLSTVIETDIPVFEILFLLVAVFFFQPLIEVLNNLLDKIFHQDNFSHDKVTIISRELLSAIQLETIYQNSLPLIQSFLGAKCLDLFIENESIFKDKFHQRNSDVLFFKEGEFAKILLEAGKMTTIDQMRVQLSDTKELASLEKFDAALILPVINRNCLVGILFLSAKINGESYFSKEIELLELLSLQMGIALENIRLYKIAQAQRLLKEELSVASHIQRMLLPLEIPTGKNFQTKSKY